MAASKLLANSDRQADDGVFSRDVIDTAMMNLQLPVLRQALAKAEQAYGPAITRDLGKVIDRLQVRTGWLDRCIQAMTLNTLPKALLWQKIRRLRRVLPSGWRMLSRRGKWETDPDFSDYSKVISVNPGSPAKSLALSVKST